MEPKQPTLLDDPFQEAGTGVGSLTDLLQSIRTLDQAIRKARQELSDMLQLRYQLAEQAAAKLRETALSDFSDGEYRIRMVRKYTVLAPEQLYTIAPDLVQVETIYKPNMRNVRAAMESPRRVELGLESLIAQTDEVEVGPETRKTQKEVLANTNVQPDQ